MEGDLVRTLYTGFKGKNNSSYQLLSSICGEKLFLTNSFEGLKRDIMDVTDEYDLVIMFGLDTNLKDMVRIERVSEYKNVKAVSKMDCDAICKFINERGIECIVSDIPTKYLCNAAYWHMLRKVDGRAMFIHIPSMKNMSEGMMDKMLKCLEEVENV